MIRLHCSRCGKVVSTPVPDDTIVRARIECPECLEIERDEFKEIIDNFFKEAL